MEGKDEKREGERVVRVGEDTSKLISPKRDIESIRSNSSNAPTELVLKTFLHAECACWPALQKSSILS